MDADLAEIRELKTVFDTKISAMITAINEQGNLDVANLKADTAAMRSSLETIAEEARDNQWKSALLKIANVGITVAGCSYRDCRGCTAGRFGSRADRWGACGAGRK